MAYAEIHEVEKAVPKVGVLCRATAWFAERGITARRVISDDGSAYKSKLWVQTCGELGTAPKWTKSYRPEAGGKIKRFHRTLLDGWAYARH